MVWTAASGWKRFFRMTTGTWYGYYHNEVPAAMCRSDLQGVAPDWRGALFQSRRHVGDCWA